MTTAMMNLYLFFQIIIVFFLINSELALMSVAAKSYIRNAVLYECHKGVNASPAARSI